MRHEKIIKRPDGSRVCISVIFSIFSVDENPKYNLVVSTCPPGKRKFINTVDGNSYQYWRLDAPGREQYKKDKYMAVVSKAELLEAKLELWNKLKPNH